MGNIQWRVIKFFLSAAGLNLHIGLQSPHRSVSSVGIVCEYFLRSCEICVTRAIRLDVCRCAPPPNFLPDILLGGGTTHGKTLVCGEAIWLWSRARNNMGRTCDHSRVYWHNPSEQYGHDVGQERFRCLLFPLSWTLCRSSDCFGFARLKRKADGSGDGKANSYSIHCSNISSVPAHYAAKKRVGRCRRAQCFIWMRPRD